MVDIMIEKDMKTKTNRPKSASTKLTPSRGAASHSPEDYVDRAAHLYGQTEARRIMRGLPPRIAGTVPGGGDREAGN